MPVCVLQGTELRSSSQKNIEQIALSSGSIRVWLYKLHQITKTPQDGLNKEQQQRSLKGRGLPTRKIHENIHKRSQSIYWFVKCGEWLMNNWINVKQRASSKPAGKIVSFPTLHFFHGFRSFASLPPFSSLPNSLAFLAQYS